MEVIRKRAGTLRLDDGLVDITDPCYNRDVWCRMSDVKVKPGVWNCYSYEGVDKDWGMRQWICQIVTAEADDADAAEQKVRSGKSWRTIGEIGVDAGLAGFFSHKPDFTDKEWSELCDWMFHDAKLSDIFVRDLNGHDGFWTSSGCGDGCYTVHAIRNSKQEIIALEIRF